MATNMMMTSLLLQISKIILTAVSSQRQVIQRIIRLTKTDLSEKSKKEKKSDNMMI